ncbi:hypothetical protein K525DRAFT_274276 [Schizophyllum commune Loenen D]|nr:hypothetical protein K525DRAFT_274276 [Schizophyllum commune Loenen D]
MVGTRPNSARTPSTRLRESRKDAATITALSGKKRKLPSGPPPPPRAPDKSKSSSTEPQLQDGLSQEELDMILAARGAKKHGKKATTAASSSKKSNADDEDEAVEELEEVADDIHARNMALLAQEFGSDTGNVSDDVDSQPPSKKLRQALASHPNDDMFESDEQTSSLVAAGHVEDHLDNEDGLSNGIEIVDTVAPSTPKPKKGKVTINGNFTPRAAVLAAHSKLMARLGVVLDAYPADVDAAAWQAVGQTVETADEQIRGIVMGAYQRAAQDPVRQQNLITYTNYGRSGIKTELVRKVRAGMKFVLHIGTMDEHVIQNGVIWALKKKNYLFGELDLKTCTNDRNKPFGCVVFEYAIGETCFTTSKANGEAAKHMINARQVPWNLIALVASMIEHCMKEWATGKHVLVEFSDEIGRSAHSRHMEYISKLSRKCPSHMQTVQQKMLYNILRDQEKEYILEDGNSDDGDLDGIDCERLEREAGGGVGDTAGAENMPEVNMA